MSKGAVLTEHADLAEVGERVLPPQLVVGRVLVEDGTVLVGAGLGGQLELVGSGRVTGHGDVAAHERLLVAVALQLPAEQIERPTEIWRDALRKRRRPLAPDVPDVRIAERSAHANRLDRGRGCVGLEHRSAALQETSRPVANHLKAGQQRARILVLLVDGQEELDVEAERVPVAERVGEREADQLLVRIHVALAQTRMDNSPSGVDRAGCPVPARELTLGSDGKDPPLADRQCARAEDAALRIHRHDQRVANEQVAGARLDAAGAHRRRASAGSISSP